MGQNKIEMRVNRDEGENELRINRDELMVDVKNRTETRIKMRL